MRASTDQIRRLALRLACRVAPLAAATLSIASGVLPPGASAYTAYVGNYGAGTVTPINTATNSAGAAIAVGLQPWGIAITPDGKPAYVANSGSGTVTPINIATNAAGAPIAVFAPIAVAITPDGKTAYVAGNSGSVTPIDTATNTARSPIATGAG